MSLDQQLDSFLYFGGDFPDLAEGVEEVASPDGFYMCMECHKITNYWKPGQVCEGCEARGERQQEEQHDAV
jgi:hypothetical protein